MLMNGLTFQEDPVVDIMMEAGVGMILSAIALVSILSIAIPLVLRWPLAGEGPPDDDEPHQIPSDYAHGQLRLPTSKQ